PAAGSDGSGVARPAAEAEWRHAAAKRQVWIGEDDDEHTGEIAINCRQRDAEEAAGADAEDRSRRRAEARRGEARVQGDCRPGNVRLAGVRRKDGVYRPPAHRE